MYCCLFYRSARSHVFFTFCHVFRRINLLRATLAPTTTPPPLSYCPKPYLHLTLPTLRKIKLFPVNLLHIRGVDKVNSGEIVDTCTEIE